MGTMSSPYGEPAAGTFAVFGALKHDDIVGHEFTHGVIDHSAGLIYFSQSGALNESFSDIFGETIDLTNGAGLDTPEVRWLIEEELLPSTGMGIGNFGCVLALRPSMGTMSSPYGEPAAGDSASLHWTKE